MTRNLKRLCQFSLQSYYSSYILLRFLFYMEIFHNTKVK